MARDPYKKIIATLGLTPEEEIVWRAQRAKEEGWKEFLKKLKELHREKRLKKKPL
jgi:hypothetical protein